VIGGSLWTDDRVPLFKEVQSQEFGVSDGMMSSDQWGYFEGAADCGPANRREPSGQEWAEIERWNAVYCRAGKSRVGKRYVALSSCKR
jgi:hypothetical protein